MGLSIKDVKITEGFWKDYQELNQNVTIDAVYNRFVETGRIEAMSCKWQPGMENEPHFYWDSDVAKWVEGACYSLINKKDEKLLEKVESIVDDICNAQQDDGYYNIYYTCVKPGERFTVRENHELYCAGHLMEAAVAYFEATGKDRLLNAMEKYADLIHRLFVVEKSTKFVTPGHEEIELALLRMYKCTGKTKFLDLCKFFVEERGKHLEARTLNFRRSYCQSHMPVREFETAEGHAVRALYLYVAMADLALETEDTELYKACERVFDDIVNKKMYITGGTGSSYQGETFTLPYDLPSETAYSETCASIGLILFGQKMLDNEPKSKYADAVERAMYNGMLSGLSESGDEFFYENPLEIRLENHIRHTSTGVKERLPITQRQKFFWCSCCPPNINRILASMGRFIYGENDGIYFVHQYISSECEKIKMNTDYPNNGLVKIECRDIKKIALRVPFWCDEFEVNCKYSEKDGYIYIDEPKEVIVDFKMRAKLYFANSSVYDCISKAAVMYGPVVYCAEQCDNSAKLQCLYLSDNINIESESGFLKVDGYEMVKSCGLYEDKPAKMKKTKITLIPYRKFANRGEQDMRVWLNYLFGEIK